MRLELAKYLFDMQHAAASLAAFIQGRTWSDYESNAMLRAAVERQFEIIGEALAQLAKRDPDMAARISEYQRVIAFRNVLIHGYAEVDDRLVWDLSQTRLPKLRQQVDELLQKA
jgi:uncharacterized protein with HEPN domain